MILLIDNYDSFSYNLYQLIGAVNSNLTVIRNDDTTVDGIDALQPDAIILSPGPGKPEDAGICIETVQKLGCRYPILGVCLGHQSICRAYGATVSYAKALMHGKQSITHLNPNCTLFKNLPDTIPAARYHSLAVVEGTMPDCLEITARAEDGEIMGVKHREYPVFGVQFHPESIMTPDGPQILKNFLGLIL
ncbi:MAG: aminodeoxychorismate/anthranilate synthase component II [Intestinimonas sp.]|jgi:anthranilate synthase component 2|nr:aminodeoxychorismate/anthranilate synthase component II [Intestinimonas sp.]